MQRSWGSGCSSQNSELEVRRPEFLLLFTHSTVANQVSTLCWECQHGKVPAMKELRVAGKI